MTERPIIFSGRMVRAILEGRKTQTRRVIKPQPEHNPLNGGLIFSDRLAHPHWNRKRGIKQYCEPGDNLWVRETWHTDFDDLDEARAAQQDIMGPMGRCPVIYRPDKEADGYTEGYRSRPSIHMPRWASRITLAARSVRVERIQEISEVDAAAEGIERSHMPSDTIRLFSVLWDTINEKRGFGWDANPSCWAIEFERVE